MDKKSKILTAVFFGLIAASIITSFVKFVVLRHYDIAAHLPCDPSQESCFVYECDPEWEECSDDPKENTSYYKIITARADRPQICADEGLCTIAPCAAGGEKHCEETICTPDIAAENETECFGPDEYAASLEEDIPVGESEEDTEETPFEDGVLEVSPLPIETE